MHLRPIFNVAWAKLEQDGFARTVVGGSTAGLLRPIATAKPQQCGLGPSIHGPRVSDLGALLLAL